MGHLFSFATQFSQVHDKRGGGGGGGGGVGVKINREWEQNIKENLETKIGLILDHEHLLTSLNISISCILQSY